MSDGRDVPLLALANARASSRPRRAVVLRAVAAVALLPLSFGYTIGFTSPALAQLSEELSLSAFAGSAFASLVNVGAMVGAIAAWRLSDALGRQRTIALWAGATIVGYLLIAAAPAGAVGLVIGRVVAGCAIGGSSVTVNVYVAEVSPPELRGALGAVFQCAVTLGILAVYGLGLVVRWRALAIIGAAPPLLLLLAARALVPETPRWLLLVKGDLPGARRAMVHLRAGADDESVDDELEDLARAQPADVDDDDAVRARNYAPPSLSEADCCGRGAAHDERPNPRATGAAAHAERSGVLSDEAMSAAVAVAEQESCAEPCEAHAAQPQQQQEASAGPDVGAQAAADGDVEAHAGVDDAVARRAAPAPEPRAPPGAAPRVSARGAASQPPPLPSLCGADRWVLRPLAISMCLMLLQQGSGINAVIFFAQRILADAGYAAPSAALAVAAAQAVVTALAAPLMDSIGRRPLLISAASGMCASQAVIAAFFLNGARQPALALCGLCGAVASFSLGLGAIPWSLMGEVFPQRARGIASSAATLCNWSASFAVTLSFDALVRALGAGGLFALYAGVCALAALFVAAVVPETRGRTLEQIERHFRQL